MSDYTVHPASFKDPSGFIFQANGHVYRQVNHSYAENYELLMKSGLYDELVKQERLIPHEELNDLIAEKATWYKTLQPQKVPFISYPYEWCFEQLRDAALLTLSILRTSLSYGMIIKDATPYNIQFLNSRPVFIDTLSFEKYDPSKSWVAYRQFCKIFLFPLYLEFYLKTDIQKILIAYLDGIPADITSRLLPLKSGLNLGVWLHVYLQNTIKSNTKGKSESSFNKKKLLNLANHLESIIHGFSLHPGRSEWSVYYQETILGKGYLQDKEKIFMDFIEYTDAQKALDLGANDGHFSALLAGKNIEVIAVDNDSRSISKLYSDMKKKKIKNILPLVIDLASPSPAIGFNNKERASFTERINADLVLALALVHHLVIGTNITLPMLADYFSTIAPQLIIEFIPKEDEKVQQMLASRKDVFSDYTQDHFEQQFAKYFTFRKKVKVNGTSRTMYLMDRNKA